MENKNLFVAMALFALIYFGGQILFPPQKAPSDLNNVESSSSDTIAVTESLGVDTVLSLNSTIVDLPEEIYTISNDHVVYSISSHGGSITSVLLKDYYKTANHDSEHYDFAPIGRGSRSLSFIKGQGSFSFLENIRLVKSTNQSNDSRKLLLAGYTLTGLPVQIIYSLGSTFELDLKIEISNSTGSPVSGYFEYGLRNEFDPEVKIGSYDFLGTVTMLGDATEKNTTKDLSKEKFAPKDTVNWSSFADKYFMAALVPGQSADVFEISSDNGIVNQTFSSQNYTANTNSTTTLNITYYFGPKDVDVLAEIGSGLEHSVDFGWFSFFANPLFHFLKFIHSYVPNWGLSIILLTVLIKLVFWPLTDKSYSSMKAMQTLQPEMLKLREKFKNDKMRMNQEIMELYKKHRLNPAAGCLPMIVQLPVFIALYNVLLNAVDLRHAPFVFWISDLSVKDPFYITPLVMGGTMYIQQKLTPTAANMEPMQQKMMQFLPVVFTFLFLNFPAGLVIYWLVNNLLTILQQLIIKKRG